MVSGQTRIEPAQNQTARINPHPLLPLRTGVRAGDRCKGWDTNCITVNPQGQLAAPFFNSCTDGFPLAGAACIGMLDTIRQNNRSAFPGVVCQQC